MAGLFGLSPRSTKESDAKVLNKIKSSRASNTIVLKGSKGGSLIERISLINSIVEKEFPDKSMYELCTTLEALDGYIGKVISEGICSLDTETNSLDPITCILAGASLYTPGQKPIYAPMHHVSYITGMEVANQIADAVMKEQLERLIKHDVKIVYHNAKFDIRVLKHQLAVDLSDLTFWDTQVASILLNENESHRLKDLYPKYCDKSGNKSLSYGDIFSGIPFTHVPIKSGYLYAAKDAKITWELFKFQEPYLTKTSQICMAKDLTKIAKLYNEVELPCIKVIAQMEDNGICIDLEHAQKLSAETHLVLEQKHKVFNAVCDLYAKEIATYKASNGNHGLENPINVGSPKQMAVLIYDILLLKNKDKRKPRGTGEDIIGAIDHPIVNAILEIRGVEKLLSTYIDKLPNSICPKTGKIHANFNQNGAKTGRLSSDSPNLQNIPSKKDKEQKIRKMFKPSEGCYLISGDFSQQEPRILAHRSKDKKLLQAYLAGKDIYAFLGSITFNVPYEMCLEFNPDGSKNPEGKKRRDSMKVLVLGIMYGMETPAIAESLKIPTKDAQKIKDAFFSAFPEIRVYLDEEKIKYLVTGFVETSWGRKRRLPDLTLPLYTFTYMEGQSKSFDPLDFDNACEVSTEVEDYIQDHFWNLLVNSRGWKQTAAIKEKATADGILILDNRTKINDAIRQAMNSPIQGTAGDMVKNAMVCIGNYRYQEKLAREDLTYVFNEQIVEWAKEFEQLGGKLLLQVHDELIIEAPIPNAFRAAELLSLLMVTSAQAVISVPMRTDLEISTRWSGTKIEKVA